MSLLASPLVIALAQMVLMFAGTIFLRINDHASEFIFEKFSLLQSHVPALYGYRAAFGLTRDFDQYFAIRVFQIAVQSLFLVIFAIILFRLIKGRHPEPVGLRMELLYLGSYLIFFYPSVDLFLGSYQYPRLFTENTERFVQCFILPVANVVLVYLVTKRFWEGSFGRLVRSRNQRLGHTARYQRSGVDDNGK